MVIWPEFRVGQYIDDNQRDGALYCIVGYRPRIGLFQAVIHSKANKVKSGHSQALLMKLLSDFLGRKSLKGLEITAKVL